VVLENEVGQKGRAERMNISSREGIAESQLHVEVISAFSAGNRWRDGEILVNARDPTGALKARKPVKT
jgi:hypothetical protein